MRQGILTSLSMAVGAAMASVDSTGIYDEHMNQPSWRSRKTAVAKRRHSKRHRSRAPITYRPLRALESIPANAQMAVAYSYGDMSWVSVRRFPDLIGTKIGKRNNIRVPINY